MDDVVETQRGGQAGGMTPERAQVIIGLFRALHPDAADEIGHYVDRIVHGLGDDVTDSDAVVRDAGGPVSMHAARAAVEFVMAAMLTASR
jgi:hypothetical protein